MTVTVTKKLPHGKIPFAQMTNAELRDFAMKCNENFELLQKRLSDSEQAIFELQRRLASFKTFDIYHVDSLPEPNRKLAKQIFFVDSVVPGEEGIKYAFVCNKVGTIWKWEKVGSTNISIDFGGIPFVKYVKKQEERQ